MKKIWSILIVFICVNANAQFSETEINFSKGTQKGLVITANEMNQVLAFKALNEVLKAKDANVTSVPVGTSELMFDNINLPNISPALVDAYGVYNSGANQLVFLIDIGGTFINALNNPTLALQMQQMAKEIKLKLESTIKTAKTDSLKQELALLKAELDKVNSQLSDAQKEVKSETKDINKNEKQVSKTEQKLNETNVKKEENQSKLNQKESEMNAFPLEQLQNEIKDKNKAIKKNRKAARKLAKKNLKIQEKINDLNTSLSKNKESINTFNSAISTDSNQVAANEKRIEEFDVKGRKKEIKKLGKKQDKLEDKASSQATKIEESKQETQQKTQNKEAAASQIDTLKAKQAELQEKINQLNAKLKSLE